MPSSCSIDEMSNPDARARALGEHTDDELYDILTHIDRDAYPARYREVRDEYVRRHGALVNGRPVDDYFDRARLHRPFAERSRFKKKLLVALAVWSLLMLALRAVLYLRSRG
jgi:hypothetical protein